MIFSSINDFFDKHKDAIELLQGLYNAIDQNDISKSIDKDGLELFIEKCAAKASATGLTTGIAGPVSLFIGIPVDILNNLSQQFRVTSGIFYQKKKRAPADFEEFLQVIGLSMGVEVGRFITKNIVMAIINKIGTRMAVSSAGRLVPVLGSVVGAGTNYFFIKGVAKAVKKVNF